MGVEGGGLWKLLDAEAPPDIEQDLCGPCRSFFHIGGGAHEEHPIIPGLLNPTPLHLDFI